MSFGINNILSLNLGGIDYPGPLAPKTFEPPEALVSGKPGPWALPPSPQGEFVLEVPTVVVHGDPLPPFSALKLRSEFPSPLDAPFSLAIAKGLTPAPTWQDLVLDEVKSGAGIGLGVSSSITNGVLGAAQLAGSLVVQAGDDLAGGGLMSGKGPIQTFFPSFYRATEDVVHGAAKTLLHPKDSGSAFLAGLQQRLQYAQTNAAHDPVGAGAAVGEIAGDTTLLGVGAAGATKLLTRALLPQGPRWELLSDIEPRVANTPRSEFPNILNMTRVDGKWGMPTSRPLLEHTEPPVSIIPALTAGGRNSAGSVGEPSWLRPFSDKLNAARGDAGERGAPTPTSPVAYNGPPAFLAPTSTGGGFNSGGRVDDPSLPGLLSGETKLLTSRFTHPAATPATYSGAYNYSYSAPKMTDPTGPLDVSQAVDPTHRFGGQLTVSKDPISAGDSAPLLSGRFSVQDGNVEYIVTDNRAVGGHIKRDLGVMGLGGEKTLVTPAELNMRMMVKEYMNSGVDHPLLPQDHSIEYTPKMVYDRFQLMARKPPTETSSSGSAAAQISAEDGLLALEIFQSRNMPPAMGLRVAAAALDIAGIKEGRQQLEVRNITNEQTRNSFWDREPAGKSPLGKYVERLLGRLGLEVNSARWNPENIDLDPPYLGPRLNPSQTKPLNIVFDFSPKASDQ